MTDFETVSRVLDREMEDFERIDRIVMAVLFCLAVASLMFAGWFFSAAMLGLE
jgi:hypothetical protein